MAKHNQKKAADYKKFREWKKKRRHNQMVYERVEQFYEAMFDDFKKKVINGEISSFDQIEDPIRKVGIVKMVMDEIDGTLNIMRNMPSLRFKPEWDVQILPNFMGSFTRFYVNGKVSVYMDYYDRLGYQGNPYWEVYRGSGYPARFHLNDTVSMMDFIDKTLKEMEAEAVVNS